MQQHIKKRLVGVAVIFSLAVIFLPMLLDGSGKHRQHLDIKIPPSPTIVSDVRVEEKIIELKKKVADIPELEAIIVDEISDPPETTSVLEHTDKKSGIEDMAQTPSTDPQPAITKPQSKPETHPQPKTLNTGAAVKAVVKSQVGGNSWVIQAGSFSDKSKAYKQRDQLRKSNLAAVFIETFKYQGKTRYRVRLGPFIRRNKADVVRNKVRAKYNIKGLVMRYEK